MAKSFKTRCINNEQELNVTGWKEYFTLGKIYDAKIVTLGNNSRESVVAVGDDYQLHIIDPSCFNVLDDE